MAVPRLPFALLLRLFAMALMVLAGGSASAKGPEPPQRIGLETLGWQASPPNVVAAGGMVTTVHYVDEQHLLVTFNVRRLMKRLPDDPPGDMDRTIEAVLVEVPGGKVLARTSWRVHDTGQYLWGLGHGRFLLRIRNTLTTFMPLANLERGEAFAEKPFLQSDRRLVAVLLSAERDVVTVETVEMPKPAEGDAPADTRALQARPKWTQINFYRVVEPEVPTDKVVVQSAGLAVAKSALNLSLTSAGYIEVFPESANRWDFDFDAYTGKYMELAPFDSTCAPQPIFVSASEFVAFGCRGAIDHQVIGGFNLRGEQMWQQNFSDAHAFPNFAFAPEAGRFALSRNIVSAGSGITVDFAPSAFTTQEIRVYQMHNGKQLLRAEATPVQRAGQNYDLSPEGRHLAVVRNDAVEIHALPGLSREDEAAVRAAKALAPANERALVNLSSHRKQAIAAAPVESKLPEPVPPPAAPPPPLIPAASAVPAGTQAGDVTDEPRKPPTLYTLPTDKVNKPEGPP